MSQLNLGQFNKQRYKIIQIDKNSFWVFEKDDLVSIVTRNCYGKFSCGKEVCKMLGVANKCEHVQAVIKFLGGEHG